MGSPKGVGVTHPWSNNSSGARSGWSADRIVDDKADDLGVCGSVRCWLIPAVPSGPGVAGIGLVGVTISGYGARSCHQAAAFHDPEIVAGTMPIRSTCSPPFGTSEALSHPGDGTFPRTRAFSRRTECPRPRTSWQACSTGSMYGA